MALSRLSETAVFLYKATEYYAPECEHCLLWCDEKLSIDWVIDGEPLLSAKDQAGLPLEFSDFFASIEILTKTP